MLGDAGHVAPWPSLRLRDALDSNRYLAVVNTVELRNFMAPQTRNKDSLLRQGQVGSGLTIQ